MKLYFTSARSMEYWNGIEYQLIISDDYIPLWKKAGIYDLLYGNKRPTCKELLPELIRALTDMCVYYLDYRELVKLRPLKDKGWAFLDEVIREQVFRQATASLGMLIQVVSLYPQSCICRKKEEA